MYFIVSWDISAVEPQWGRIDEQMRNCLKNFAFVRPVNTYYMVKVSSEREYEAIHECLLNVAKAQTATVHFVSSPLFSGTGIVKKLGTSGYQGWLPQDRWTKIKEVVN